MAKFSKKEITRAVDEADKSLEEFYHEKPGAPIFLKGGEYNDVH